VEEGEADEAEKSTDGEIDVGVFFSLLAFSMFLLLLLRCLEFDLQV